MAAHEVQVGGGHLRRGSDRILRRLRAHLLRVQARDTAQQFGLREPQLGLGVDRVVGQDAPVRPDRSVEVVGVQRLRGGLQLRVVRSRGHLGRSAVRVPCGRVDDDPGETETLLADLDQLVERLADLALGGRALEEREGLSGHHREDRGDALDAELLHQHLVGVDIDLGQQEAAVVLDGETLQERAELLARLAPLGPEVDDDGHLGGALEDVGLEARLVDVDHQGGG